MPLRWDDSLVLGIDEIDNQHRSIFEHSEKLSEAAQQGTQQELVEELTTFLFEYAQMHFATEDRIMLEYKYPKIELQRSEHGEFTRDAKEFKNRIEKDGATREIAIEVSGKLIRWIYNHIRTHDREMVAYVRECMALREKYTD